MVVLQNLGCGITTVLPQLGEYKRLDQVCVATIVAQMERTGVTRLSGQPVVVDQLCTFLLAQKKTLPQLQSMVVGGAKVSRKLCQKIQRALPHVDANIVYGSSEVEPISFVSINELLREPNLNRGLLVGSLIAPLSLRLKAVDPLQPWGEIWLKGPHVVQEYIDHHPANQELKLKEGSEVWHGTGDIGTLDQQNRLWLLGRKRDLIEWQGQLCPSYSLEEELEQCQGVEHAALVMHRKTKALFVQVGDDYCPQAMRTMQKKLGLEHFMIRAVKVMPLDLRHFSRVDRKKLRELL